MEAATSSGARPFAGAAIRKVREARGLSARALSAKAGLSKAYVCKVEAGACEPSLRAFSQLAVALEMSPYEVWCVVANEGSAFLSHPPVKVEA
jgi:transcriptional regulator with XRE-family HTH domain